MPIVKLELIEPVSDPVSIEISKRWGPDRLIVFGRKRNPFYKSIVFRSVPTSMSRTQMSVIATKDGDDLTLWARDGGPLPMLDHDGHEITRLWPNDGEVPDIGAPEWWKPSTYGTWIGDSQLSPHRWTAMRIGDVFTFGREIEYQELAGYSLRYPIHSDTGTASGMATVGFNAVDVWRQESKRSNEGCMLLGLVSKDYHLARILEIDQTGDAALGFQPGEAKGEIFNNLILFGKDRQRIDEHIAEAINHNQTLTGDYKVVNGKSIHLQLRRRSINGSQPFLFGWVTRNVQTEITQAKSVSGWESAVEAASKLATDKPILFIATVLSVAALIVIIQLVLF